MVFAFLLVRRSAPSSASSSLAPAPLLMATKKKAARKPAEAVATVETDATVLAPTFPKYGFGLGPQKCRLLELACQLICLHVFIGGQGLLCSGASSATKGARASASRHVFLRMVLI